MSAEIFYYINSDKLLISRENSIYELAVYNGLLFIPDYRNDKIIILDIEKTECIKEISVPMPHGISIDDYGRIYVSSHKKNSLFIIFEGTIREVKHEKIDYPVSLAITDDVIYIANWGRGSTGQILAADRDFQNIEEFGDRKKPFKPHSCRFYNDTIYVLNRDPSAVIIYSRDGSIINTYMLGEFFDPISLMKFEEYYIIPNYIDGMVYIFNCDFIEIGNFPAGDMYPMSTAIYKDSLFISEQDGNRIHVMDISILKNQCKS